MALGQNILNLRKKNGLSQEQLGEKVNVTRQTISNWELEETAPNPEQLKLLSKAINVSVDDGAELFAVILYVFPFLTPKGIELEEEMILQKLMECPCVSPAAVHTRSFHV